MIDIDFSSNTGGWIILIIAFVLTLLKTIGLIRGDQAEQKQIEQAEQRARELLGNYNKISGEENEEAIALEQKVHQIPKHLLDPHKLNLKEKELKEQLDQIQESVYPSKFKRGNILKAYLILVGSVWIFSILWSAISEGYFIDYINGSSLATLILSILCFVLYVITGDSEKAFLKRTDDKKKEIEVELERLSKIRTFMEKKESILGSKLDELIETYVAKYDYTYDPDAFELLSSKLGSEFDEETLIDLSPGGKSRIYDSEMLDKLRELINLRFELEFDDDEIRWLMEDTRSSKEYQDFKEKLVYNQPKELRDYIENLVEIYGDEYEQKMNIFLELLKERGIKVDQEQLLEQINEVKKIVELHDFEKRLRGSETGELSDFEKEVFDASLDHIDLMEGFEFEDFLRTLFERMGYEVEHTKLTGDQGADLLLSKFNRKYAVQAKRAASKVGNKAIQEVVAAVRHYKADRAMVVVSNEFTDQAIELAKSNGVILIDRNELEKLIKKHLG